MYWVSLGSLYCVLNAVFKVKEIKSSRRVGLHQPGTVVAVMVVAEQDVRLVDVGYAVAAFKLAYALNVAELPASVLTASMVKLLLVSAEETSALVLLV